MNSIVRLCCFVGVSVALTVASPAWGVPKDLNAKSLAATCASCHGTNGKTALGSVVPGLAGTPKAVMVAQMKAFQSGVRSATIMHQLSKGYTDAQLEQLGAYFEALKK